MWSETSGTVQRVPFEDLPEPRETSLIGKAAGQRDIGDLRLTGERHYLRLVDLVLCSPFVLVSLIGPEGVVRAVVVGSSRQLSMAPRMWLRLTNRCCVRHSS